MWLDPFEQKVTFEQKRPVVRKIPCPPGVDRTGYVVYAKSGLCIDLFISSY